MRVLAVIPARGGSKRIPRKNIKSFLGKPIMAYSIAAALESGIFDEVMVSTEDEEIAAIARQYGASVPFMRSPEAASDTAVDNDVIREVVKEYEKRGKTFDYMAYIYPCAPFVTAERLRETIQLLDENDVTAISPVSKFNTPPQRGLVMRNGRLEFQYPEYMNCRSQDLEPIYYGTGQYCAFRIKEYLADPDHVTRLPIVMPENEAQDIDSLKDWEMAELKYRRFILGEK